MNLPRALAQLEHVFITNKSWRNMGGLPGLCLSGITSHTFLKIYFIALNISPDDVQKLKILVSQD
jgi:hypothetical protein